jgi:hypothetical protein
MNRRTFILTEAQTDIKEISFWYESREEGLGQRFSEEIRNCLEQIGNSPLRFPQVESEV